MNFLSNSVNSKQETPLKLVAAVDLGSNSFHLIVAKVIEKNKKIKIYKIDNIKEQVRLADGLDEKKNLSKSAQEKALFCLRMFGERLRSFSPDAVRAVATNTFRVAKNNEEFTLKCEDALGFPIEIISGVEEARLIYQGVSNTVDADGRQKLVVDIGGGSTEFIIGKGPRTKLLESVFVGCSVLNREFFSEKNIKRETFEKAIFFARKEIQVITSSFKKTGWDVAFGCSGTIKSIYDVCKANGFGENGITLNSLIELKKIILTSENLTNNLLLGLKNDRVALFPSGLVILIAIFKELKIVRMDLCDAALRTGVLYDIVGREWDNDSRSSTVEQFMIQYEIDKLQSSRVVKLSSYFSNLVFDHNDDNCKEIKKLVIWASALLELGHVISHNSYHKHSAYIISNSDMPGFARGAQHLMSMLVLGHVGKLGKVSNYLKDVYFRKALICIRLSAIFSRSRTNLHPSKMDLNVFDTSFELFISKKWIKNHPLTEYTLDQEIKEWKKLGFNFSLSFDDLVNEAVG